MGERLGKQARYYAIRMFRGEKKPFPVTDERKFNPLQHISYVLAMYVGVPLVIISGWGLLFPESVIRKAFGMSGILITDILHVTMGFFLSVFLIIHIYVSTIGYSRTANFKSIVTGYAVVADEKEDE